MKHDIRNSLILIGLLILIIISRIFVGYNFNKRIKIEDNALKKNNAEWQALQSVTIDTMLVYVLKVKIAETQKWQKQYGKYFVREDNTRETWTYLNTLVNNYCPNMEFNFENSQSNAEENLTSFSYKVSGIATVNDFYTFITHLEKQPALYTIERLVAEYFTDSSDNENVKHKVNFEFYLYSWLSPEGIPVRDIQQRQNFADQISYNAFSPKIHPFYKNVEEELHLNAENMTLVSITPQKAFIKYSDGKVYILVPGSRVAYGFLSSINWAQQSITFKINKIGVYKDFIIYLNRE